MQQIMPDVYMLDSTRPANVYLVGCAPELILIDTSMPGKTDAILAELAAAGFAPADVRAIVLTHHHVDHVGSAAELVRRTAVKVWAHRDEIPYIEQTASVKFSTFGRRLWGWFTAHLMRADPCHVDRPLQDGEELPVLDGLRVVHAPGHTLGCIGLYQPQRQLLFCGDIFFNGGPLGGKGGVKLPPRLPSLDMAQAITSARKVAELPLESVCFGHGEPILTGAAEALKAALR
ncbi:MAG TPA: MBL fold metallo-hydrolase [Anaerolineae bacterium]|nr:MBL fold metallo-hydrolase [Anaerolineae bacterium]